MGSAPTRGAPEDHLSDALGKNQRRYRLNKASDERKHSDNRGSKNSRNSAPWGEGAKDEPVKLANQAILLLD